MDDIKPKGFDIIRGYPKVDKLEPIKEEKPLDPQVDLRPKDYIPLLKEYMVTEALNILHGKGISIARFIVFLIILITLVILCI